mmetsp:Transcript_25054/g.34906  ORF Transcript_25054/g.34906 Transcript_25054/m.34906 type:complete len:621 (-) Transcript_25054:68-1930(-)|eukprot:CAMPEP_0184487136 /NCGR_PEP_ID=MMETSP0113_2-20130426/9295_1 /TAXON_ID=91329 /ORGANISM="Norrisiella sphaerica, Strain BC52" /LENGTH=620 /DNA_ID=CAMNT_0026869325 /DNA_START=238 /DNA_END=2100 /DNA_ORIENTATION=+
MGNKCCCSAGPKSPLGNAAVPRSMKDAPEKAPVEAEKAEKAPVEVERAEKATVEAVGTKKASQDDGMKKVSQDEELKKNANKVTLEDSRQLKEKDDASAWLGKEVSTPYGKGVVESRDESGMLAVKLAFGTASIHESKASIPIKAEEVGAEELKSAEADDLKTSASRTSQYVNTPYGEGELLKKTEEGMLEVELAFGRASVHESNVTYVKQGEDKENPVGKLVLTPFGKGEVVSVDEELMLQIALGYGNASIHTSKVVFLENLMGKLVSTPYGKGSVVAVEENKMLQVSLAFGTASMHESNVVYIDQEQVEAEVSSSRSPAVEGVLKTEYERIRRLHLGEKEFLPTSGERENFRFSELPLQKWGKTQIDQWLNQLKDPELQKAFGDLSFSAEHKSVDIEELVARDLQISSEDAKRLISNLESHLMSSTNVQKESLMQKTKGKKKKRKLIKKKKFWKKSDGKEKEEEKLTSPDALSKKLLNFDHRNPLVRELERTKFSGSLSSLDMSNGNLAKIGSQSRLSEIDLVQLKKVNREPKVAGERRRSELELIKLKKVQAQPRYSDSQASRPSFTELVKLKKVDRSKQKDQENKRNEPVQFVNLKPVSTPAPKVQGTQENGKSEK